MANVVVPDAAPDHDGSINRWEEALWRIVALLPVAAKSEPTPSLTCHGKNISSNVLSATMIEDLP